MSIKVSLCIPTKNRWNFLKVNLPKYLENPYIEEIVICDENGEDAKIISEEYKDNEKIKVYVNTQVLGALLNKRKVVSFAKNDFICLMDSDNFAPLSYFEAWSKYIKEKGLNEKIVYCPARTIPQPNHQGFDYRAFIGSYNFEECKRNFSNVMFNCMLNTGNYIFSKKLYMESEPDESHQELVSSCKALDVLFQNYLLFIKGNGIIGIIPNMEYDHIVHDGSYYMETCNQINTQKFYNLFK
jgi:glycosyltransferase involved in cell wall biosynthesis